MTTATCTDFWLGTSWKMTKTLAEAREYADGLDGVLADPLRLFVLPPHTALAAVRDRLGAESPVMVGAQDAHWEPDGAVTGAVSMSMVRDAGAVLVELGHAERRARFGETDEVVAAKVAAAVGTGLLPLLCVGEPREAHERGAAQGFVARQVRAALGRLTAAPRPGPGGVGLLVAYEPVWAIGAGSAAADPQHVDAVTAVVRDEVETLLPGVEARVLYGGSVDHHNAGELVRRCEVDGLFVGRAAWTVAGLRDLVTTCRTALAGRRLAGTQSSARTIHPGKED